MEACHPDSRTKETPLLNCIADKEALSRVLACHTMWEGNGNTEDKRFVDNKKRGITINGVDMQEYMKMKSQNTAKNTPTRKYNKRKGTKNEQLTTICWTTEQYLTLCNQEEIRW